MNRCYQFSLRLSLAELLLCHSPDHLGQSVYLGLERLELSIHTRIATGWPLHLLPHPADHLGTASDHMGNLFCTVVAV